MTLGGRKKYEALLNVEHDRPLTPSELRFLEHYRTKHPELVEMEEAGREGFSLLRGLALDDEPESPVRFENRVIRKFRIQSVRETASYWAPAICGGLVAAMALLAAFQLLGRSPEMKPLSVAGSEARRGAPAKPVFPDIGDTARPQ